MGRARHPRPLPALLVVGTVLAAMAAVLALATARPQAQAALQGRLGSLRTVPVPPPSDVDRYVRDFRILTVLGKALFWDVQAGSDNRTACATCHFHAGADHRRQNQLASTPDTARPVPINRLLGRDDYPFLVLERQADRSPFVRDTRWVTGSAGVAARQFVDVPDGVLADRGADPESASAPQVNGLKVRQVTGRNSPSVINAAFNVRNFHDGRASHVFTGVTPFGDSDTALNALVVEDGAPRPHRVRMDNASLASQAVGPPLNPVEMSYAGRTWPKLGRRMLGRVALAAQQVAADDGVLGEFANTDGLGLRPDITYAVLVRAAFRPEFWAATAVVDGAGRILEGVAAPRSSDEFTQMEFNFALFWALALQAYQSTLISDDSPFDRFAEGRGSLSSLESAGLNEFQGDARCTECHGGPEFSAAAFTSVLAAGADAGRVDTFGFFRLGISPVADDIGAGGRDGFGLPLFPAAPQASARGTFKAPGLRNVEFTGPFFHNGGMSTLEQVVDFYNRRGDFREDGNLPASLLAVNLGSRSGERLSAFMKALTDERVKYERAPFDHPSLCVPSGHPEASPGVLARDETVDGAPLARDTWVLVPAVGRGGSAVPLQTFEELLLGVGNDGTRAHTMTIPCRPDGGHPSARR